MGGILAGLTIMIFVPKAFSFSYPYIPKTKAIGEANNDEFEEKKLVDSNMKKVQDLVTSSNDNKTNEILHSATGTVNPEVKLENTKMIENSKEEFAKRSINSSTNSNIEVTINDEGHKWI